MNALGIGGGREHTDVLGCRQTQVDPAMGKLCGRNVTPVVDDRGV